MSNKSKTVLVAMSGGVDSSSAAAILLEQGYNVVGLTITTHKPDDSCRIEDNKKSCCSITGIVDARKVCDTLGIEHKLIDLTQLFKDTVISNFISEYLKGRTPNPCVVCNNLIKWGPFLQKADEYGAELFATGHYGKIFKNEDNGRFYISRGLDDKKDQSYALWGLTQEQLARTMFPLENMTKEETRAVAKKYNLPVFNKSESQDICFIPNGDYHSFLRKNIPDIDEKIGKGEIILNDKKIGVHEGFPYYTIGQRRGLGISHTSPLYVNRIDPENNKVFVAVDEDLFEDGLVASEINMQKYSELDESKEYVVKIRYNDRGKPAKCKIGDDGKLYVTFIERRRAVTPGQSVVIYDGDDVVGGGIIE